MVVTFYSFKGGVGRSMAMVNVGEILASRGYRVVLADWDLEAPGLERYLLPLDGGHDAYIRQIDAYLAHDGITDLLRDYKASLTRPARPDTPLPDDHVRLGKVAVRRPSSALVSVAGEGRPEDSLHFIGAGRRDADGRDRYGEFVRSFDWDEFYDKWAGDAYLEFFRHDLVGDPASGVRGFADLLLVDSRTGVTEQGGVCTHDLADLVVLFSAANEANLEGTRWMADALAQPRLVEARGGRPLALMPVPSRIEQTSQKEELVDFRSRFTAALRDYVPTALGPPDAFVLEAEIPYMPFYSFTERVVAREPHARREQKLYGAYAFLADAIVRMGVGAGLLDARGRTEAPRPRFRAARPDPPREPVLLTYEQRDRDAAAALAAQLQSAGAHVVSPLQSSDQQWAVQFDRMLAACAGMVVLTGDDGLTPLLEADVAAARRRQAFHRFRTVIVHCGAAHDAAPLHFDGTPSEELAFDTIAALSAGAATSVDDAASPYVGWRPFSERDARCFFGREMELAAVAEQVAARGVARTRWLQVEGFAGVGKSSFALAGVVPTVRRGLLTGTRQPLRLACCRLDANPLASLAVSLMPLMPAADITERSLLETLRTTDDGLATSLQRTHDEGPVLLVLDQLEEVADADPFERERLSSLLRVALQAEAPRLYVISTVRTERLDGLHEFVNRVGPIERFLLHPLHERAIPSVVSGPAAVAGLTFEPGLLERIVGEVAQVRAVPGVASQLLQAVWTGRRGRTLTHAAYDEAGGLAQAIVAHANQVLEPYASKPEGRQLARLLLGLVSSSGTRLTVSRDDAVHLASGEVPGARIVETATAAALVMPTHGRVTLVHDALLGPGSVVRAWFDTTLPELRARDELEAAAQAWDAAGRPDSGLPSGALFERLAAAEAPSVRASAFLEAARAYHARLAADAEAASADRQHRVEIAQEASAAEAHRVRSAHRIARLTQAALIVLTAGLLAMWFWGYTSSRRAQLATADSLAAEAMAVVDVQPDQGLDLALQAASHGETERVVSALRRALTTSRVRRRFVHAGGVLRATIDATGQRVFTLGSDGRAYVWELQATEPVRRIDGGVSEFVDGDLSRDGRRVVLASRDGSARVWTFGDRQDPIVLRGDGIPSLVRFAADGAAVLTVPIVRGSAARAANDGVVLRLAAVAAESSGRLALWDAATGQLRGALPTPTLPEAVAVSPDAGLVVLAHGLQGGTEGVTLDVWDAVTGPRPQPFRLPAAARLTAFALSGDGQRLVCAYRHPTESGALLWNTRGEPQRLALRADDATAAALDATGARLLLGLGDGTSQLITLATQAGGVASAAANSSAPAAIMAQQTASRPVSGAAGTLTTTFDSRELTGHVGPVRAVAFSADGSQAATASADGTIRVWDALAERDPIVLRGHEGAVTHLAFSPDGTSLLSIADDNSARVWDLTPAGGAEGVTFSELVSVAQQRQAAVGGPGSTGGRSGWW